MERRKIDKKKIYIYGEKKVKNGTMGGRSSAPLLWEYLHVRVTNRHIFVASAEGLHFPERGRERRAPRTLNRDAFFGPASAPRLSSRIEAAFPGD